MVAVPVSKPQAVFPDAGWTKYVPEKTFAAVCVSWICSKLLLPFASADESVSVAVVPLTCPVMVVFAPKHAEAWVNTRAVPVMAPLAACCKPTVNASEGVPVVVVRDTAQLPPTVVAVVVPVIVGVVGVVGGAVGVVGVGASGLRPGKVGGVAVVVGKVGGAAVGVLGGAGVAVVSVLGPERADVALPPQPASTTNNPSRQAEIILMRLPPQLRRPGGLPGYRLDSGFLSRGGSARYFVQSGAPEMPWARAKIPGSL